MKLIDRRLDQLGQPLGVSATLGLRLHHRRSVRTEAHEVLEVRLRQRGRITHRLLGRNRAVALDGERQAIVVRALANTGFCDREVGAPHRIVDRIDADQIDRHPPIHRVLLGLDVAASLVHVELDVQLAVVLEREQVVRRINDAHRRVPLDVARGYRARFRLLDAQYGFVDILVQCEGQCLEVANDLVHVLDDTLHRLMLVQHAINAERPDRRAAQRREQHAPHGVAKRMPESALQRLEAKLGHVLIVFALCGFYQLRPNQPAEIDCLCHVGCSCVPPAFTRRRPTPPLTRGEFVKELGSRTKMREMGNGKWEMQSVSRFPFPLSRCLLLGVQLHDKLFLRSDRDVVPRRSLQHAAAVGVAVDRDPR